MKILVLNSGSSSIKFKLFEDKKPVLSGLIEKIGRDSYSKVVVAQSGEIFENHTPLKNHQEGIDTMYSLIRQSGLLQDFNALDGIGHRIVHGGEIFKQSTILDDNAIKGIEEVATLAPLHNPAHLAGIKECIKLGKNVPNVAVFDTVFHQTMPKDAYLYPLPYEIYEKYHIRKYGFHGTSHGYVSKQAAKFLNINLHEFNAISLHLGAGASVCAIQGGKCVDTSMGLTPLEGLMMATRCGDIDPAIIFHLARNANLSIDELDTMCNKNSGLLGICGFNDMRAIEDNMDKGDEMAILAYDMLVRRIKKYIGAYYALLGRIDAIIFTAGIGENDSRVRKSVCDGLSHFGVKIDPNLNNKRSPEIRCLDLPGASIKTLVVPTDEEFAIAIETENLIKDKQ